jgi:L-ascorbate metabolism protein UlaG (beta-lactamase superfamily)
MKITFIAQSGFIIEEANQIICIDLWADNPLHPISLDQIPKVNHVFVTHDHQDHDLQFGMQIAQRDGATFHSSYDISIYAAENGVQNTEKASIGGSYKSGDIEVVLVHAEHTSNIGIPVGFIIKIGNRTIYHMGDTGYFKGFDFLAEVYNIDTLFIPIGARYTMGPIEASYAVRDINPKYIIPMHYNTSPTIQQDPVFFKDLCHQRSPESQVLIMNPGDTIEV